MSRSISLALPDVLVEKSRTYARTKGVSFNRFMREILEEKIGTAGEQDRWFQEMVEEIRPAGYSLNGWTWNREDLYDA